MEKKESKTTAPKSTKRGRKPKAEKILLGDAVEAVTKATGIKAVVDWFSEKTGIDCGCEARKEKLNNLFSKKSSFKKPNCLTAEQYDRLKLFFATEKHVLHKPDQDLIVEIHASVFNHKPVRPCSCTPAVWREYKDDLKIVFDEYKPVEEQLLSNEG